jgi:hypothetical protein
MSRADTICGLHPEISDIEYHADAITPEPALSSSGIRTLLNETPAHFAARNPRLTQWPDNTIESTREQDLGSVAHALILGKGARFKVLNLADYRNKDGSEAKTFNNAEAKRAKQQAESEGFIVIDHDTHMAAQAIAKSATKRLVEKFGTWPIGESELVGIWKRPTRHGDIFGRMLLDHFSHKAATIIDIKTTTKPISDDEIPKSLASIGADIQAAWYIEGVSTIFPELMGLVQFIFLFVEQQPPYSARPVRVSESWLTRARFRIDRAADVFARCLKANDWPAYPHDELIVQAPSWLETKWTNEELEEAV